MVMELSLFLSPLLSQLCDSREISSCGVGWGEMGPTGPFSLALQGCGHPCPRHHNDNLLGLLFFLSLTNAMYTFAPCFSGKVSVDWEWKEAVAWQDFWFLGKSRASSASHRVAGDAALPSCSWRWFPVDASAGGRYKCFNNLPHTCHFTIDDRCSHTSVPLCSPKLLLALITIYANWDACREWHLHGVWVGTVGMSLSDDGMPQPSSLL